MSEWYPIETAPHGTYVLVYRPHAKGIPKFGVDYFDEEDKLAPWVGRPTLWAAIKLPPASGVDLKGNAGTLASSEGLPTDTVPSQGARD